MSNKRAKYLTKEVKYFHIENYKTLMKKILKGTDKWKDILCFQIARINIVQMSILSKIIYRSMPIKIPMASFIEVEKKIPKFM